MCPLAVVFTLCWPGVSVRCGQSVQSHMLYTVNTQQPVLPSQSGNNWSLGHCETQPGDTCELPSSPTLASFIKSSRGAHLSLAKVIFGYLCEYFRVPTLAAGSAQNNLESDIITRV